MKNAKVTESVDKLNYSLSGIQVKEREIKNPIILKNVKLKVEERDIRCMKGDCWRDCADCG